MGALGSGRSRARRSPLAAARPPGALRRRLVGHWLGLRVGSAFLGLALDPHLFAVGVDLGE
eukprot:1321663-Pyramimonas_sp.AAC.1